MNRAIVLLAIAALPALAGCSAAPAVLGGLAAAASLYSAADKLTAAAAPIVAAGCTEYEKHKTAAEADPLVDAGQRTTRTSPSQ